MGSQPSQNMDGNGKCIEDMNMFLFYVQVKFSFVWGSKYLCLVAYNLSHSRRFGRRGPSLCSPIMMKDAVLKAQRYLLRQRDQRLPKGTGHG